MRLYRLTAKASVLALLTALPLPLIAQDAPAKATPSLPVQAPAYPSVKGLTGIYLAADIARGRNEYIKAASYYRRALALAPTDPVLAGRLIDMEIAGGEMDRAVVPARNLLAAGYHDDLAQIVLMMNDIHNADYSEVITRIGNTPGLGPLGAGLLTAWMEIGEGKVDQGLAQFDKLGTSKGLERFAAYHKALALSYLGRFDDAEKIYESQAGDGAIAMTRRGAIARIQTLSQVGRDADALKLLTSLFGTDLDPELTRIHATLIAGKPLAYTHVTSVADGAAEAFFTIAAALQTELPPKVTLLYARMAQNLRPTHVEDLLLTGNLLERLDQPAMAADTYLQVPRGNPNYYRAETARAEALRRAGRPDAAREVLDQLAAAHPDLPAVQVARGNFYRQIGDCTEGMRSLDQAVEDYSIGDQRAWFAHYIRGMCHDSEGNWSSAQTDFKAALKLNPQDANLLNYYGYSMIEQGKDMPAALAMIQKAAKLSPDAGYIVDSLGWALYRMGKTDQAVAPLERAVELMPQNAEVNDHLGDVYWAVGRKTEARYQWQRALTCAPGSQEAGLLKRKIRAGLNAVVADQSRSVHQVAQDDG